VPGFTIESARYNFNTHDVEADLNYPRPVIAGGTGATSATEALVNLGAEQAYQTITNYDSDLFFPGSFRSAADAFHPPVDGRPFAGICYVADNPPSPSSSAPPNSYITLEARDVTGGPKYVRQKTAGVWGAWVVDGTDVFVNVIGDTMTGDLTINKAWPALVLNKPASGTGSVIHGQTNGLPRWVMFLGTSATEGGGNSGSDFSIDRFDDAGVNAGSALSISRASGIVTLNSGINASGVINTTGNITSTGTITAGNINSGDINSTGNISAVGTLHTSGPVVCSSAAGVVVDGSEGTNPVIATALRVLGSPGSPGFGPVYLQGLSYPGVWGGWRMDVAGSMYDFRNDSNAVKSGGSTSWVVASDARTKTVLGDYTRGLDAITWLRPVRYVFKGNDTIEPPLARTVPPYPNSQNHGPAVRRTEYIGLVAQEAELTLPEIVTKSAGYVDGAAVQDLRNLDVTALLFTLINAVKELKWRLEALEAQRQ
jgi:hypothetical protein